MRSRMALTFGELELDLVAGDAPPLTAARVVAQDVHLVLGDAPAGREEAEEEAASPQEVAAAAARDHHPRRPGSIVVAAAREGAPLVVQAVVYDFDRRPAVREVDVFEALMGAFEEARARGMRSIAVEPLGTEHAGLEPAAFARLLAQVCYTAAELDTTLRHVHLLVRSSTELARYEALLREMVEGRSRRR